MLNTEHADAGNRKKSCNGYIMLPKVLRKHLFCSNPCMPYVSVTFWKSIWLYTIQKKEDATEFFGANMLTCLKSCAEVVWTCLQTIVVCNELFPLVILYGGEECQSEHPPKWTRIWKCLSFLLIKIIAQFTFLSFIFVGVLSSIKPLNGFARMTYTSLYSLY